MTSGESNAASFPATGDSSRSARVLIVGGDADFRAALVKTLNRRHHRCAHVNRLDEGRSAIVRHRFDLLLLNPTLPDGDGLDLAQLVQKTNPTTKTIVFTEVSSFKIALRAIRCGAVDFIRTPVELGEFVDRVDAALVKSLTEKHREQRVKRLQGLCRDLNSARNEIADQVDVLCNDLVTAYEDLTDQINDVAMASEFRTLLRQELDMEEVLRTTLEYLLGKTGPTNAAVFLPDVDGHFSLGAYVNYDCPRESIDRLLDHLCGAICPQMSDEPELVSFADAKEFADWIGLDESGFLGQSQVIAFSCQHEAECLAVIVLFRSATSPFEPRLAGTLDILRSIFAEQLAQIIRVHHRAGSVWPNEAGEEFEDDFGFGGGIAA